MPLLEIYTNADITHPGNIAEKASSLTADLLNKPESYVMVKIMSGQTITFAGNSDPAAHVKLKSLGLPEDNTTEFSSRLCSFIQAELNIDCARIYIEFSNPERHMWGWDSSTF